MSYNTTELTDLELVDEYIEKCRQFVNPYLLRQVTNRGLYHIINFLPHDIAEARSVARARMAAMGKYIGDPEIEKISKEIDRLQSLLNKANELKITDVDKLLPLLAEMTQRAEYVRDYFKESKLPA